MSYLVGTKVQGAIQHAVETVEVCANELTKRVKSAVMTIKQQRTSRRIAIHVRTDCDLSNGVPLLPGDTEHRECKCHEERLFDEREHVHGTLFDHIHRLTRNE